MCANAQPAIKKTANLQKPVRYYLCRSVALKSWTISSREISWKEMLRVGMSLCCFVALLLCHSAVFHILFDQLFDNSQYPIHIRRRDLTEPEILGIDHDVRPFFTGAEAAGLGNPDRDIRPALFGPGFELPTDFGTVCRRTGLTPTFSVIYTHQHMTNIWCRFWFDRSCQIDLTDSCK